MRLWRFAQGDAHLAQDLLSARTSPVRESVGRYDVKSRCLHGGGNSLLSAISGTLSGAPFRWLEGRKV